MKVRYKKTGAQGYSNKFNPHGVGEVLLPDDSAFIKDLDVFICDQWIDMGTAFKNKLLIPDNYNMYFREPLDDEERERGYYG